VATATPQNIDSDKRKSFPANSHAIAAANPANTTTITAARGIRNHGNERSSIITFFARSSSFDPDPLIQVQVVAILLRIDESK
jgi:hypothetical protein